MCSQNGANIFSEEILPLRNSSKKPFKKVIAKLRLVSPFLLLSKKVTNLMWMVCRLVTEEVISELQNERFCQNAHREKSEGLSCSNNLGCLQIQKLPKRITPFLWQLSRRIRPLRLLQNRFKFVWHYSFHFQPQISGCFLRICCEVNSCSFLIGVSVNCLKGIYQYSLGIGEGKHCWISV